MVVSAAQAANQSETYSQTLSKVPAIEIPAQVTKTIQNTEKDQQAIVAAGLVRVVAIQNEAALIPTVASVASALPEIAASTAAAAAKAAPKLAEKIAMRAAQAAPDYAPAIAAAVAKQVPSKAVQVADSVQKGTRGVDAQIIAAVGQVVPQSLPAVERLISGPLASQNGGPTIVQTPKDVAAPTAVTGTEEGYDYSRLNP